MITRLSVFVFFLVIASDLLVGIVGSINGIKNEGVTPILLPSHAEETLNVEARVSSSGISQKYVAIDNTHEFSFVKLLADAELVHNKLEPIMRSLYFRIFRINLDSPCRLRERIDFCANGVEDGSDNSFETPSGVTLDAPECVPKCYVGRCQPYEITGSAFLNGLEHFVVRYPNEPDAADWDPKDLYSNSMWYKDILGFYPSREEKPVYVDLMHNPPSHTGYKGGDDWKEIYDLQCSSEDDVPCDQTEHLYRLISGMQSSVAAWSAWNYKCVNPIAAYQLKSELPRYLSNPKFYSKMLGDHPDRLENLYYTFQALLKTVCRLTPFLTGFTNSLGKQKEHEQLQHSLFDFLSAEYELCRDVDPVYDHRTCEGCQPRYTSNVAAQLKHPRLIEKFNNISDVIDCLGCEKCRLHGKLKLTALQIVVRSVGWTEHMMLERNEIVALLHALDYFAQSIIFVHKFNEQHKRHMVLYPLRLMLAVLLVITVVYRQELLQALCHCTIVEEEHEDAVAE